MVLPLYPFVLYAITGHWAIICNEDTHILHGFACGSFNEFVFCQTGKDANRFMPRRKWTHSNQGYFTWDEGPSLDPYSVIDSVSVKMAKI